MKVLLPRYLLYFLIIVFGQCGIYSFKDSSIPAEVKTIKIELFENKASIVNVELANNVTAEFRRLVANQTNLVQTTLKSDLVISGYISRYEVELQGIDPVKQTANQNQLVTVFHLIVKSNLEDPTIYRNIETDIQVLKQFDGDATLDQVEPDLVGPITSELANLIFSKAFSNW